MGHRLTKIYTRTGDTGLTGLGNGKRVDKDSARIEAIGTIDELNCSLGLIAAHPVPDEIHRCLIRIQHKLFDAGGELSLPEQCLISDTDVAQIEDLIDRFNDSLPPLKEFVLPGGDEAGALCHMARAICRRAERCIVRLRHCETVNDHTVHLINRLSDLLFVMARVLTRASGRSEILWHHEHQRKVESDH